jgi:lipase ATG15
MTFHSKAIAFSSPGDYMVADHLGLIPSDEREREILFSKIHHYANALDPIFTGKCGRFGNWVRNLKEFYKCYLGGYAVETGNHVGNVCLYNTRYKSFLRWFDLRFHRLTNLIENFINVEPPPVCAFQAQQVTDCSKWTFE